MKRKHLALVLGLAVMSSSVMTPCTAAEPEAETLQAQEAEGGEVQPEVTQDQTEPEAPAEAAPESSPEAAPEEAPAPAAEEIFEESSPEIVEESADELEMDEAASALAASLSSLPLLTLTTFT